MICTLKTFQVITAACVLHNLGEVHGECFNELWLHDADQAAIFPSLALLHTQVVMLMVVVFLHVMLMVLVFLHVTLMVLVFLHVML